MLVMMFLTIATDSLILKRGLGMDTKEFLVSSQLGTGLPGDLFLLSFAYVPAMLLVMRLRDAGVGGWIRALRTPYNVLMTLFSLYAFVAMALWRFGPNFAGEALGSHCEDAMRGAAVSLGGFQIGTFKTTASLFFWSKFIEWIDSVFLLYDKKPISILHGYHHLGAPIAMGSLVVSNAEFVWIFVLWNGLIHTVMYFYFCCAGLGIKLSFLRPFITSMQILQFVTGMVYLMKSYGNSTLPGGECSSQGRSFTFIFQYVYVLVVLGLFLHFFAQQYLKPSSKMKKVAGKAA